MWVSVGSSKARRLKVELDGQMIFDSDCFLLKYDADSMEDGKTTVILEITGDVDGEPVEQP